MEHFPFLRFLNQTRFRSPYARDFRDDAVFDRHFPTTIRTREQLESYLRCRQACREAILGERTAWKHYERFLASL